MAAAQGCVVKIELGVGLLQDRHPPSSGLRFLRIDIQILMAARKLSTLVAEVVLSIHDRDTVINGDVFRFSEDKELQDIKAIRLLALVVEDLLDSGSFFSERGASGEEPAVTETALRDASRSDTVGPKEAEV